MTAKTSDCVKFQAVDSLVIKNDVTTINRAPKKYEYAVTDMFAGYFFKTGAWKFCRIVVRHHSPRPPKEDDIHKVYKQKDINQTKIKP